MAPTTRAGSKRASGEVPDTNRLTKKAKERVKKAAKPAKPAETEEPAKEAPQYFHFLDLSPELRNRVYEFAEEDHGLRFAPQVFRSCPHHKKKAHKDRIWKFFAFTQVCRQIRAEYRPLWIQNSSVRVSSNSNLDSFVGDFLHHTDTFKHAPKLLQFSWDHGTSNSLRFNLTALLRLRAHCPSFHVEFVPLKVARGDDCDDDICDPCMERSYRMAHNSDFDSDFDEEECFCPDYDMDQKEWELFKYDQMEYTSSIQDFIHNPNEGWAKDVRDGKVTISCTFSKITDHVTFKILCKDPVCQTTANSKPAWDLLKRWGILELSDSPYGMDFVVAYEGKEITEEGGYKMINSVVREARIMKMPSKR